MPQTRMKTKDILALAVAALGGAVFIVGLIYLYLYCTKMRPKRRRYENQDSTSSMRSSLRARSHNMQAEVASTSTPRPPMNPLILMTYVQKMKYQKEQMPDASKC